MSDYTEEIERLLAEAEALTDSPLKVQLLEEAVRLADLHGDAERGFEIRRSLVGVAHMAGLPEQMLVAYSWCLSQCDRQPDRFEVSSLLWRYRWVINQLPRFPEISRGQIEAALADMTRRYLQAGSTLRPVHLLTRLVAIQMEDRDWADRAHGALLAAGRDRLSDSPAAEQDFAVWYLVWSGQDELALATAEPLLAGKLGDSYVPEQIYSELLLPLLRLRRLDRAVAFHHKGYRLLVRKSPFRVLGNLGDHLVFLSLTNNLARAVQLFEKILPVALATASVSERFDVYLAGRTLLDRLQEQDKQQIKLRLAATFPLYDTSGSYEVLRLSSWLTTQLHDLATRFDARNGNDAHKKHITDLAKRQQLFTPYPLS